MVEEIGDRFQEETKYNRERLSAGGTLDWGSEPSVYKEYPDAKKERLPAPQLKERMTLDECLRKRRSIRDFSQKLIAKEQLAYLLWAATGISRREEGYEFRTAPSAGALYPIETYVVVNGVEGLEKGVYHYSIRSHALEILKSGDLSDEIMQAALGQEMCSAAAVVFVWTAVFERSKWKYRQRAYRYVYLDAGHIAQNLALSATSIGLGSCHIGAFYDDEVNRMINVDGAQESTVYMSAVGRY